MYAWQVALDHIPLFLTGLRNTVLLLVVSTVIASVFAVPLALVLTRKVPVAAPIIEAVSYVFRGTPLIVQVYLLYYGLAQFAFIRTSVLWPWLREAWTCLLIAFSLGTCAYLVQILRGAIEAVPHGEVEAARAVGMTPFQTLRIVVLPNAFRRALPSYENEIIFLLHATAIASLVTVIDLVGAGRNFNTIYYFTYEGFAIAGVIYLAIVGVIRLSFGLLERRLLVHLRRAGI
ncbi:Histidine transport system permease protein HisM [Starkeya nomas]|uniref:Histidine transport system permease protein HisM n=1 Tax=Starkeya nomas TaxID=2666134 RepID=A0A5S9NN42_9HYPH|nr:ABC transporter permease subunit [Starkeya nomas]CAA0091739.1 Histidine transport system permease protein HisM [Starkeya nomas]